LYFIGVIKEGIVGRNYKCKVIYGRDNGEGDAKTTVVK
jgi:hypothetical protein